MRVQYVFDAVYNLLRDAVGHPLTDEEKRSADNLKRRHELKELWQQHIRVEQLRFRATTRQQRAAEARPDAAQLHAQRS